MDIQTITATSRCTDDYMQLIHINLNSSHLVNVRVTNSSLNYYGKGVYITDTGMNSSSAILMDGCWIRGYPNEAIQVELGRSKLTLANSTVTNRNVGELHSPSRALAMGLSVHVHYNFSCNQNYSVMIKNVSFVQNHLSTLFHALSPPVVYLQNTGPVTFINCSFCNNSGTAIQAFNSYFYFSNNIVFVNNTAYEGGALAFLGISYVVLANNTNIVFQNNSAKRAGGAVYVKEIYSTEKCFFQFQSNDVHPHCSPQIQHTSEVNVSQINVNISFINNTAHIGGNAVYGSLLDSCSVLGCSGWTLLESNFIQIHFEPSLKTDMSLFTSDPERVCLCKDGTVDCTLLFHREKRYPGEVFYISAVIVGDRFGTVDWAVYAQFLPTDNVTALVLGELQQVQLIGHNRCTELQYSVFSNPSFSDIVLVLTANDVIVPKYPSKVEIRSINSDVEDYMKNNTISQGMYSFPVYINVTLLPCPLGFTVTNSVSGSQYCDCDIELMRIGVKCNINNQTIHRYAPL